MSTLVLSELTLTAIQAEATRAHLKHGRAFDAFYRNYSSGDQFKPSSSRRPTRSHTS